MWVIFEIRVCMDGKWASVSEISSDVWCSLTDKSGVYCLGCVSRFEKKPDFCPWPKVAWLSSVHLHFQKLCCFRPHVVLKPLNCVCKVSSEDNVLRESINLFIHLLLNVQRVDVLIQRVNFFSILGWFISVKASSSVSGFFSPVCWQALVCYSHKVELFAYVINTEFIVLVHLREVCQNTCLNHRSQFY